MNQINLTKKLRTMILLYKILNCLIKGQAYFCGICLSGTENKISLNYEINVESKGEPEQFATVSNVIESVLGKQVHEYVSTFEGICENCTKSLTEAYVFIKKCQNNAANFTKVLDLFNNSMKNEDYGNCKTLFMSINMENLTMQYFNDNEMFTSKSDAMNRFLLLNSPKIKVEKTEKDTDKVQKTKKTKMQRNQEKNMSTVNIKTSDMLYNPNNAQELKCKVCLKNYATKWNLRNHYLKVHAPKIYKCTKCRRLFGSKTILNLHTNHNHCEAICSECGKRFTNKSSFLKHELTHKNTFVCSDCGRTYKSSGSYKNHIKMNICKQNHMANRNDAKYTCDYCNKKYTQKMSLRVHIQYEHGNYKGHICEWCGKKFWAQSRLKAHIVKHTREKNFTCSICRGKFVTKESLLYHTRLHTGEKPYKCNECGCSFISASRKVYHMKTYHQEATVECNICHSKFSSHSYLQKHMNKCHKEPDNADKNDNYKNSAKGDIKVHEPKLQKKNNIENNIETKNSLPDINMPGLLDDNTHQGQDKTSEGSFAKTLTGNEYLCKITDVYSMEYGIK